MPPTHSASVFFFLPLSMSPDRLSEIVGFFFFFFFFFFSAIRPPRSAVFPPNFAFPVWLAGSGPLLSIAVCAPSLERIGFFEIASFLLEFDARCQLALLLANFHSFLDALSFLGHPFMCLRNLSPFRITSCLRKQGDFGSPPQCSGLSHVSRLFLPAVNLGVNNNDRTS